MKIRLITICCLSLIIVFLLLALGATEGTAQEPQVTVTYDPLPVGWKEFSCPESQLLCLTFGEGETDYSGGYGKVGPEGMIVVFVSQWPALHDFPAGYASSWEKITVDGYPALYTRRNDQYSDYMLYHVDVGLLPNVIQIGVDLCGPEGGGDGYESCHIGIDPLLEQTKEMVGRLHFNMGGAPAAGGSCTAHMSYPTDIRPSDTLAPEIYFSGANNQSVEPLSYSLYIDGVQTSQVSWSGNDTLVEVSYTCPNGKEGHDTFTIPGSGPSGIPTRIPPTAATRGEPPDDGSILGPLIVIGALGAGVAGAGVVGGAILIKVLKGSQSPKGKKSSAKQPSEQKEAEKEEQDKLLGYELHLSAEKLKVNQGAPAQLGVTAVANYSRSGYRDAPGVAIAISLPPGAVGLQVVPLTGVGRILCNISLAGEVAARQVTLTVTGQAPGWQDEARVVVELEQNYQVEFF